MAVNEKRIWVSRVDTKEIPTSDVKIAFDQVLDGMAALKEMQPVATEPEEADEERLSILEAHLDRTLTKALRPCALGAAGCRHDVHVGLPGATEIEDIVVQVTCDAMTFDDEYEAGQADERCEAHHMALLQDIDKYFTITAGRLGELESQLHQQQAAVQDTQTDITTLLY